MKYLSVCSGIEAATCAWHPLGWTPVAFSEIEAFPSAVLAHHYPEVPNLGDMTTIAPRILSGEIEAPDVLVGGTPCQAFSVAGLRGSLDDHRGQLSLAFVRLAGAIDSVRRGQGKPPSIIVWENVPGVLSTRDNAFGCFLAGLAGEDAPLVAPGGRWSDAGCVHGPERTVAWRILDAQYFGLAQRRRRVFVVASAGDWADPISVLFEREGVRRDSPPSRDSREGAPGGVAGGAGGRPGQPYTVANCLTQRMHKGINTTLDEGQTPILAHALRGEGVDASEDGTGRGVPLVPVGVCPTLRAGGNRTGGDRPPGTDVDTADSLIPIAFHPTQDPISSTDGTTHAIGCGAKQGQASIAVAFTQNTRDEVRLIGGDGQIVGAISAERGMKQQAYLSFFCKDHGGDALDGISPTLRAMGHSGSHANAGGQVAVAFDTYNQSIDGDVTHTLRVSTDNGLQSTPHVMLAVPPAPTFFFQDDTTPKVTEERSGCLRRDAGGEGACVLTPARQVRRLTVEECELLQGFPRGFTNVPYRNKPAADGPRYKALGNSMAVPCMAWIGKRIQGATK